MALSPTAVFESFNPLYNGWSCVLETPLEVHTAQALNEVVPLLEKADRAARDGFWAALLLSYEAAPAFDSAMEVHPSNGFPLGWLAVFRKPSSRPGDFKPETIPNPRWNPLIAQFLRGPLPPPTHCRLNNGGGHAEENMHGLIYLVGLIVVILAILSFFGLR